MKKISYLFEPLNRVKDKHKLILIFGQVGIALVLWSWKGGGLIPGPWAMTRSVGQILSRASFWDDLLSSVMLTVKGMGFALILALLVSYASLIPFFEPLARFIIKCRYLTLTGLIFLFTLLTRNGHDLKISLLVFGITPFFVTSFLSAISQINVEEYELCETLGLSPWQTWLEVVVIGRLDLVLDVLRQNFAIAWMMITMVEGLSMSEGGLGTLLIKSNKYIDLGTVFGILVIILAIGILFDSALAYTRRWLFPYTQLKILDK